MANLIGLTGARNVHSGIDIRQEGVAAMAKPMRFYGSDQMHNCDQLAMETLGLDNQALVRIPSKPDMTMDLGALMDAVQADRNSGLNSACVITTAGTVNMLVH